MSVMYQDLWQPEKTSIINLFEKMTSNVTKFRQSIGSSPSRSTQRLPTINESCQCSKANQQRKLQQQFYGNQHTLVTKAAELLEKQGQHTLSRLLSFMSEYIMKVEEQVSKDLLCVCQKKKLEEFEQFQHKINFLREENHKFFKMIEEKDQQCQTLKLQVKQLTKQKEQLRYEIATIYNRQNGEDVGMQAEMTKQFTSRTISSNSSRVSEFRVAWPELIIPSGQGTGTHRKYFEASPGDHQAHSKQPLLEQNTNISAFRKPKIFGFSSGSFC